MGNEASVSYTHLDVYKRQVPVSIKRHNAKLQTLCLIVLILTIGFEIGSNGEVLLALRAIGLKAAVISLLSVLGTVLCINTVSYTHLDVYKRQD